MADAMETLKGLLGDGAEDKIKNVMSSLSSGNSGGGVDLAGSRRTDRRDQLHDEQHGRYDGTAYGEPDARQAHRGSCRTG